MNGRMKRYKDALKETPGPVSLDSVPRVSIDYKGLLSYAKKKGVCPSELSFEESSQFMTELVPGELEKVKDGWENSTK